MRARICGMDMPTGEPRRLGATVLSFFGTAMPFRCSQCETAQKSILIAHYSFTYPDACGT